MSKKEFKDLIFYEIYPTSFFDSNNDGIGDLKGIKEKLHYINDLGCNAIWLNPFYPSPFMDGGYDVKDFFNVDPRFGTLVDFDELIKKAHSLGIKIIIDLVAGHASEENKDFLKSAEAKRNDKSDLFIWNSSVWNYEPGYRLIAGRHQRNGCYLVNFFSTQPAFNYGFKEIKYPSWQMSYLDERTFQARNYMLSVMRFWLIRGVDGFRVDMADSLVKDDEDKSATIEVWQYLFSHIKKEFPDSFFVSEWSNPEQALKAGFDADFVLDHWDNFFHRLVRSNKDTRGDNLFKGADLSFFISDIKSRYESSKKYNSYLALISGNHDTPRISSFLSIEELKTFYLMLYCLPGIPFLYYGDEIMMKHIDLDSKDGGFQRTGDRTPMQWDLSNNYGFSLIEKELYLPVDKENKVNVNQALNDDESLLNYIKKLIRLRKTIDSLTSDIFEIKEDSRILVIDRGEVKLIINFSNVTIELENEVIFSSGKANILKKNEGALVKN